MAEQTQIPPRGDVSATFSIQTEERTPGTSLAQRALAMATGLADRQPERHGAASDCPNGPAGAEAQSNTASDGAAPDDFEPYIKIEIRVSACEDSQGIEVPLGYYHRGKWCPYLLVPTEEGLWMEPDDVASWLASVAGALIASISARMLSTSEPLRNS